MGLFQKKSLPDIDKLKAKKDVKGLIKALWWNWADHKGEPIIDTLYRKKAAQSLSEIADIKVMKSLVEVIHDAAIHYHRSNEYAELSIHKKNAKVLSCISQLAKESLSQIGQPAIEPIFKYIQKWNLDLTNDTNRKRPYFDSAKKSMLEVLTKIGDGETVFKNLQRAKKNVRSDTYLLVSKYWFSEISASEEGILTLARMAAEAVKTNDLELFNTIRSVLITNRKLKRFADVVRTHLPTSEHAQILNILCKDDNIKMILGMQDKNEKCVHCGSQFHKPETMNDKVNFDAMQKARVGCSRCGTAVCFSCAANSANERGKTGNCFCPKCGAELGRGGEAGEVGKHFSGWD